MIDRKMAIKDVLNNYPGSAGVFEELGLGCVGCEAALFENIEQAAQVHGVDIDTLLASLMERIGE